jgi:hypothetical protein
MATVAAAAGAAAAAAAAGADERETKGHIPLYAGSDVPSLGGIFKAVPYCLGEALNPFDVHTTHEQVGNSANVRIVQKTYMVAAGKEYFVRCTQQRQSGSAGMMGTHFGARVFVDCGTGSESLGAEDHFFWFNPEELSSGDDSVYDITGYYETSESALKFVFQNLQQSQAPAAAVEGAAAAAAAVDAAIKPIGRVAVHFAEVQEMFAADPSAKRQRHQPRVAMLPNSAGSQELAQKNFTSVGTAAGSRHVHGATDREAALSDDVVHVEVMRFVDFASALSMSNGQLFKSLSKFNAVPLPVFTEVHSARSDCIARLLQELQAQRHGMDVAGAAEDYSSINNSVAVTDLVELVDRFVSPAAAYILCTGQNPPAGRYAETLVQAPPARTGHARDGREKEQALAAFLRANPDRFEVTWKA